MEIGASGRAHLLVAVPKDERPLVIGKMGAGDTGGR